MRVLAIINLDGHNNGAQTDTFSNIPFRISNFLEANKPKEAFTGNQPFIPA
jgi:hypothetical protein